MYGAIKYKSAAGHTSTELLRTIEFLLVFQGEDFEDCLEISRTISRRELQLGGLKPSNSGVLLFTTVSYPTLPQDFEE